MKNTPRLKHAPIVLSKRKLLQGAAVSGIAVITGIAPFLFAQSSVSAGEKQTSKVLIAYYSRTGTTRELANQIRQHTGGELFELQTRHAYPKEYRATTRQAKRELEENFRPQLTAELPNIDTYEQLFIGYPNWWGTLPMALFSFLERYRFAGKTLIPFCTHEGSQLGRSVSDIQSLCPQAMILEGIAVRGGGIDQVQSESARRNVQAWLKTVVIAT